MTPYFISMKLLLLCVVPAVWSIYNNICHAIFDDLMHYIAFYSHYMLILITGRWSDAAVLEEYTASANAGTCNALLSVCAVRSE